jgi:DNA-binding transcriptional ArsR family regulator
MDVALRALADPTRRRILRLVRDQEQSAGVIAGNFDLSRPAVSQHLKVLREAGLIEERRDATRRLYRARESAMAELLAELGGFWEGALDELREAAEHADGRP